MIRDLDTNSAIVSRSRFARGGRSRQCPPRHPRRLKRRNPSIPWSIRASAPSRGLMCSPEAPRAPGPRVPFPASARHPPHAKTEQAPLKPSLELINLASSPRALPRPTPTHRDRPSRRARSVGPASAVLLIYSSTIHAPIVRLSYSNVQKECDGAAARASRLKGRRELSAPVDRGHYRCTPPVYASRSHRNPRR